MCDRTTDSTHRCVHIIIARVRALPHSQHRLYVSELKAALDGNIAGLQRFNILEYMPEDIQTGGSVEGLDDCYMNEGSA